MQPAPVDYTQLEEADLQARYHAHDPRALAELYRRHEPSLRATAERMSWHNPSQADDDMQDLFLHLSRSQIQDRYNPQSPWIPWTQKVLLRRILSRRRSEAARNRRHQTLLEREGVRNAAPSVAESIGMTELQQALRLCLDAIKQHYRDVLEADLRGLSLHDIASQLDIPYGTAGGRLSRARDQLGQCLQTRGYPVPGRDRS